MVLDRDRGNGSDLLTARVLLSPQWGASARCFAPCGGIDTLLCPLRGHRQTALPPTGALTTQASHRRAKALHDFNIRQLSLMPCVSGRKEARSHDIDNRST